MNSWWELGEGIGHRRDKLDVWRLTCPFCDEKGNFTLAYHAEKKKPNPDKRTPVASNKIAAAATAALEGYRCMNY